MTAARSLWLATVAGLLAGCATSHPLIEAASAGDDARVEYILSQGKVPVDSPGPEGSTALYWAAYEGHTSTIELLLKAGANPRSRTCPYRHPR